MEFWEKTFGESEPAASRKGSTLSPETQRRVNLLFRPEEQNTVAILLTTECGNNLPFLEELDEYELERFRFAALKLSDGNLDKLRESIGEICLWLPVLDTMSQSIIDGYQILQLQSSKKNLAQRSGFHTEAQSTRFQTSRLSYSTGPGLPDQRR
jgi:hypothetical protein